MIGSLFVRGWRGSETGALFVRGWRDEGSVQIITIDTDASGRRTNNEDDEIITLVMGFLRTL